MTKLPYTQKRCENRTKLHNEIKNTLNGLQTSRTWTLYTRNLILYDFETSSSKI